MKPLRSLSAFLLIFMAVPFFARIHAAEEVEPLQLYELSHSINTTEFLGDGSQDQSFYCSAGYPSLHLQAEDAARYPALEEQFGLLEEGCSSKIRNMASETYETALSMAEADPEGTQYQNFESLIRLYFSRADSLICSFIEMDSGYFGTHTLSERKYGHTLYTQTGEPVPLQDVLADPSAAIPLIEEGLREILSDDEMTGASETLAGYFDLALNDPDALSEDPVLSRITWTLSPFGVSFYFTDNALAFRDGTIKIDLSRAEHPGLFTGLCTQLPGSWSMDLLCNADLSEAYHVDLNGDGSSEELLLIPQYNPEWYAYSSLDIRCGQNSLSHDLYGYWMNAHLLKTGAGNWALYVQLAMDNDYEQLEVFTIDAATGQASHAGTVDGGVTRDLWSWENEDTSGTNVENAFRFTDPENMKLYKRSDMFSTLEVTLPCHAGEDGLPVPDSAWYSYSEDKELTAKQDFSLILVQEDGTETGEVPITAGEVLTFCRTDLENWVDFSKQDGTLCRAYRDESIWPQCINGVSVTDLFDGTIFAG